MAGFSISTIRAGVDSAGGRGFAVVQERQTLLGRVLAGAVVLAIGVILLAIFVLLVVPALVILLAAAGVHAVKRALRATREPNGVLDGRRNVRVIRPEQP